MPSQKQLGNECFKKQQYSEAVVHYKKYVEADHEDNKNAYFNMSLCYSKLNKPQLSVEAAEQALSIDKLYFKCYYRLAHQYKKIKGKDYQVFINAANFHKWAHQDQNSEREEMKILANNYRQVAFKKQPQDNKLNQPLQQIIEHCETQGDRTSLIEIDKPLDEWVSQWNEGTQSEQAKWVEIEYIMQQIDYEYGLNLAYFYINRLNNPQGKKVTLLKLQQLRGKLQKDQIINIEQLGIDPKEETVTRDNESDDQNLFQEPNLESKPSIIAQESAKNAKKQPQVVKVQKKQAQKVNSRVKNPKEILQQKLQQTKRQVQQLNGTNNSLQANNNNESKPLTSKDTEKKVQKVEQSKQNTSKTTKPNNSSQIKVEPLISTSNQSKKQNVALSQTSIEAYYQKFCGQLSSCSDIFASTYRSVLKILEQKQMNTNLKGQLMVQLRNRVKKFNLLMQSASENQQFIIYDLLKRNDLVEYASFLAPKFHKK